MRIRTLVLGLPLTAALTGCGGGSALPELYPVKGVVKRAGQPVSGGVVQFSPDATRAELLVNSEVAADGSYTLSTVPATGSRGRHEVGAPAGTYLVTYTPPIADQTAGGTVASPVTLPSMVTITPGTNDLTIDLPKDGAGPRSGAGPTRAGPRAGRGGL